MNHRLTIAEINKRKPKDSMMTAIKTVGIKKNHSMIEARCLCGNTIIVASRCVANGNTKSCGCLRELRRESVENMNNRLPKNSRFTIVAYNEDKNGKLKKQGLIVICDCTKVLICRKPDVMNGKSLSCGCYHIDVVKKMNSKWNCPDKKILQCFHDMRLRCYSEKSNNYRFYGARGVRVCREWLDDPQKFIDWAVKNGWERGLHLDKDIIPHKLGIPALLYSPEMCCFVTPKENSECKRNRIKKIAA